MIDRSGFREKFGNIEKVDPFKNLNDLEMMLHEKTNNLNREEKIKLINLFKPEELRETDIEIVSMNDSRVANVLPNDKRSKIMSTFGLGGCYGVLIFTEQQGERSAFLGHYSSIYFKECKERIKEFAHNNPTIKESEIKRAVLAVMGEYQEDEQTKEYQLKPMASESDSLNLLIKTVKSEIGEDVDIKMELYDMIMTGEAGETEFSVKIPSAEEGPVVYKFSSLDEHKLSVNPENEK